MSPRAEAPKIEGAQEGAEELLTERDVPPEPPREPTPGTHAGVPEDATVPAHVRLTPGFCARAAVGGALMGLANLVPGISGGTMLVAAGVYRAFIDAVADVSRLRLTKQSLGVLILVAGSAVVAIGAFASIISLGLAHWRWGMYSLFIGLTLGGAPLLIRLAKPFSRGAWAGVGCGALVMAGLVVLQEFSPDGSGAGGWVMLVLAGVAGASAMILPGVSGAFLLLLLGQYERVVGAIKGFIDAGRAGDVSGALAELSVLVPVGVGVVVGIAVVSNVLRFVLHRYEKATLGVLLGLLLAAPLGLWPFERGVPPEVGETFEGEIVTAENIDELRDPENAKAWRTERYTPGVARGLGALGLVVVGFGATLALSRLGREKTASTTHEAAGASSARAPKSS